MSWYGPFIGDRIYTPYVPILQNPFSGRQGAILRAHVTTLNPSKGPQPRKGTQEWV